jgi:putative ABC transport system permease protein
MRDVSRYIDSSGADVFVSQRGVRTMHMSSSSIRVGAVTRIRGLAGVRWADPILYEQGTLIASGRRELTYLIGFEPDAHGGPTTLIDGDEPGTGEIVLDERAAATLGIGIGGRVETLGRSWRVSGLATGMTNITNTGPT